MSGRGAACAEQVWSVLLSHEEGGTATYTIPQLCRAVGRSRRTVQYGLQQLRDAGRVGLAEQVAPGVWLRRIYRPDSDDGDPLDVFRQRAVQPSNVGGA